MHQDRGICRGLCKEYKVRKPKDGTSRYLAGQVRCQICGIFIKREGCHDVEGNSVSDNIQHVYCNCCNCMVRSKPRNKPGIKPNTKTANEHYSDLKQIMQDKSER